MSLTLLVGLLSLAVLLMLFGGVLAATDAGYTSLSRSDLDELAEEHPKQGTTIHNISEDLEGHLVVLNFVRVTSETFAAVLITIAIDSVFERLWMTLMITGVVIAVLNIILIGVGPRQLGQRYPEEIVRMSAPLVRVLAVLFTPIRPVLGRIGERAFSAREARDERLKNEQLFSLVDRAAEQDLLEEDEQDIIHSVVEFSDTIVREVMVPRTDMVTVEATDSVEHAMDAFLSSRYSRIPVIAGDVDEVVGVLYLRDVTAFVYRRPDETCTSPVTRVMKPARFVPDLQSADDLLRQMQQEANHLALVVDEYGGIAGLVTMEDLIEELLGDIHDEHDREVPDVVAQHDGTFIVNARMDLEEFGELFDQELEDDDVETVGGLVAKALGRLAEENDVVEISGIQLRVLEVEKKRQRLQSLLAKWVGTPDIEDTTTGQHDLPRYEREDSNAK